MLSAPLLCKAFTPLVCRAFAATTCVSLCFSGDSLSTTDVCTSLCSYLLYFYCCALIPFNRLVCWSYTICDENYRWPMVTNEDDIWSKVARSLNIHIPSEVILFLPLSTKSCLNHIMAPIINVRGKDKDICELSLRNRRYIGQLWRRSYCLSWRSSKKGYPSG